ncbi:kinesin-like protein KIN-14P [Vigna umbellata]|uniref:kinesin-like protein KIN-14P n=1 Tax=Vigna umbellata TaxID=87088 RepID=UPI001F5F1B8F|nr:kinesin-like protein KIN-14P [Vigna umbellata]
MNPPSNNHNIEPRDLGNSGSNINNGVNSPQRKVLSGTKLQRVLHSPLMAEPSPTLINQVGSNKFPEVFRVKQGSYADHPSAKISELMKSTSLDNAPTQSLLSVVNGILEESVERRNGEIPQRVACLLRKVVQEIERRISTQAEHLKTQNNIFKAREEKYHSRIRVLEALASGTEEEREIVSINQLQHLKTERIEKEEKKVDELKQTRMTKMQEEKENDDKTKEISTLKQKLETMKKTYEVQCSQMERKTKEENRADGKEINRYINELEDKTMEISTLNQKLETMKKTCEEQRLKLEAKAEEGKMTDEKDVMKMLEDKNIEISTLRKNLETLETISKTYEVQCSQLKAKVEEKNMTDGTDSIRYVKELEDKNMEISTLKQKLDKVETMAKTYEVECSQLKAKVEEKNVTDGKDSIRYIKELEDKNMEISILIKKLETMKKEYEVQCSRLEAKAEEKKNEEGKEVSRYIKELEDKDMEISTLRQKLETVTKTYEVQCSQLKAKAEEEKMENGKEAISYIKELEEKNKEISAYRQELETMKKTYEVQCSQMKAKTEEEKIANGNETIRYIKELEEKNMEISAFKQELETMKKTHEVQCSQLKANAEEEKMANGREIIKYTKELEDKNMEILAFKQELETTKEAYEAQCSELKAKAQDEKMANEKEIMKYMKEVEDKSMEISSFKQELETTKRTHEVRCSEWEAKVEAGKEELKEKSQEYENLLEKLRNKVKENETLYESKYQKWMQKENQIRKDVNIQFSSIKTLKLSWESIKQDALKEQIIYSEECKKLGLNLKPLVDAAENYQIVLAENRKLFNEVQELKGNIRVYCRLRPFLPGQKEKQSIVEHIGETELVVANPSKPGKEGLKTFKFNKVYGPTSTQAGVYADIQAFIRSVLDGYNVCIFAYGQTGSGKTFTMSGPNNATPETVGVNYRALNDLFSISTSRKSSIEYEIGVQVIEIYNEQVRDLLTTDASKKTLGILSNAQPNGLAVPDATMQPVKSPEDVIKLMDIGLKNRAKGSTAMNERSSRSHSVVSIHVRGMDKKAGSSLHGNLHLVDLAGSERVDRSEVTGDRLKEAQHINKSLSALGDVIFALSQKTAHVPYRNSKLTQLLQTSLGGQAKTLMLVQINSDVKSFSESLSTLKFAERVSGVELGAAKSSKEGRDVRELMEQVASLKDTISVKDEEIEKLQLLKDLKNVYPGANSENVETA